MESSLASFWKSCSQVYYRLPVFLSSRMLLGDAISFSTTFSADNNTVSELSSLHEDDLNFRQPYRQARRKPLPPAEDLDGDAEYWAGVMGGGSTSRSQAISDYRDERDSFRHRWGVLCLGGCCIKVIKKGEGLDVLGAFLHFLLPRSSLARWRGCSCRERCKCHYMRTAWIWSPQVCWSLPSWAKLGTDTIPCRMQKWDK